MYSLDTLQMLQDWINKEDILAHDLAVSYIKSNSDLLDTNLEEFVRNCPPSCKLKVAEMLLKAGIELSNISLKTWEKSIFDTNPNIGNTSKWITIDTIPEVEETL